MYGNTICCWLFFAFLCLVFSLTYTIIWSEHNSNQNISNNRWIFTKISDIFENIFKNKYQYSSNIFLSTPSTLSHFVYETCSMYWDLKETKQIIVVMILQLTTDCIPLQSLLRLSSGPSIHTIMPRTHWVCLCPKYLLLINLFFGNIVSHIFTWAKNIKTEHIVHIISIHKRTLRKLAIPSSLSSTMSLVTRQT